MLLTRLSSYKKYHEYCALLQLPVSSSPVLILRQLL
jgi:hypothetical protein